MSPRGFKGLTSCRQRKTLLSPGWRRARITIAFALPMVAEVTLQELGPGVKGYLYDALVSSSWYPETVETVTTTAAAEGTADVRWRSAPKRGVTLVEPTTRTEDVAGRERKDGKVTLEEMQMFFRRGSPTSDR